MCVRMLTEYGFPVVALGLREGSIDDVPILTGYPLINDIHTVTLYVGPRHQPDFYEYIRSLKPARVIFNPGTENHEFETLLVKQGIETVEACSLVMLSSGQF